MIVGPDEREGDAPRDDSDDSGAGRIVGQDGNGDTPALRPGA